MIPQPNPESESWSLRAVRREKKNRPRMKITGAGLKQKTKRAAGRILKQGKIL